MRPPLARAPRSGPRWARLHIPARLAPWFRYLVLWRRLSPPALFLASFVVLILIGTAGLMLIPGLHAREPLGPLDSLFTMTSAVTITGLVVVDTSSQFTFAGQAFILLFIQLGGLGLVSLTTLLIGALGARLSLRSEMLAVVPTRKRDRPEVLDIVLGVTKFTLVVELCGAVLLFACWVFEHPPAEALWHAVFHAISAYCNAGFTTLPDSLVGENAPVVLVVSFLVILGGLGYLAFEELVRWWRTARAAREGRRIRVRAPHRLSSHTWSVLVMSTVLLAAGWILFAAFEWEDTLAAMSLPDKLVNSWFLSVTPRSSGFNTVDYAAVGNDTAALTMILMFIGGSPGSMGGGVKTTTVAVLIALALSRMRGHRFVGLKQRAIPPDTIERTIGIMLLALGVLVVSFFAINALQALGRPASESREEFLPIVFETVSAFSTTGLSMGYTSKLSAPAEALVILLMFIGRVGLLSFFTAALLRRGRVGNLRPAQEDVIVG